MLDQPAVPPPGRNRLNRIEEFVEGDFDFVNGLAVHDSKVGGEGKVLEFRTVASRQQPEALRQPAAVSRSRVDDRLAGAAELQRLAEEYSGMVPRTENDLVAIRQDLVCPRGRTRSWRKPCSETTVELPQKTRKIFSYILLGEMVEPKNPKISSAGYPTILLVFLNLSIQNPRLFGRGSTYNFTPTPNNLLFWCGGVLLTTS